MIHTIEYFAAKAKPLLDALDAKRDEGLKRDRELRELNDEIDAIKAQLGALNTEAGEAGHLIADVHAAAGAIGDEPGTEDAAAAVTNVVPAVRAKRKRGAAR
jgi:hypothetical protein